MIGSKTKTCIVCLVAMVALMALPGVSQAQAPTGRLEVPDHHQGVLGNNVIKVTATHLKAGVEYRIKLEVYYHKNPRTPPPKGRKAPMGYTERREFSSSDGGDVTFSFEVPLPDCHWQITAGFTLYYWDGLQWNWNGDKRATQCVDIWSDCNGNGGGEAEGCTPGYWKNHLDAWEATRYSPGDDFDTTFEVDLFDPDITLDGAVRARGGGVNRLARHGTAALLSAAHPGVPYPLSVGQVIALVQAGQDSDVDMLEANNELGCPLD